MNVPTDMYKIIVFNHIKYPNITFIDIILFKNKTYTLDTVLNNNKINFNNFILPVNSFNLV